MIYRIRRFIAWVKEPAQQERIKEWLDHVIYILSNRAGSGFKPKR